MRPWPSTSWPQASAKAARPRDGSIRAPMTWRVLTLSTGELPMGGQGRGGPAAPGVCGSGRRLLDIPADAGRGFGAFDAPGATLPSPDCRSIT